MLGDAILGPLPGGLDDLAGGPRWDWETGLRDRKPVRPGDLYFALAESDKGGCG